MARWRDTLSEIQQKERNCGLDGTIMAVALYPEFWSNMGIEGDKLDLLRRASIRAFGMEIKGYNPASRFEKIRRNLVRKVGLHCKLDAYLLADPGAVLGLVMSRHEKTDEHYSNLKAMLRVIDSDQKRPFCCMQYARAVLCATLLILEQAGYRGLRRHVLHPLKFYLNTIFSLGELAVQYFVCFITYVLSNQGPWDLSSLTCEETPRRRRLLRAQ